jgi:20S proteasome alpha/beta subunit
VIFYFSISSFHITFFFVFQLGSTAIGIQTQEGVVLAVEKRVTSPLIVPSSIEKIMEIDAHIGNDCRL